MEAKSDHSLQINLERQPRKNMVTEEEEIEIVDGAQPSPTTEDRSPETDDEQSPQAAWERLPRRKMAAEEEVVKYTHPSSSRVTEDSEEV
ncbi:hypothetical protein OG21DRAFT_1511669 [Imleria badia]|nr:hypothetical protein OG21DRAFT_1511669 [Imleria badia]